MIDFLAAAAAAVGGVTAAVSVTGSIDLVQFSSVGKHWKIVGCL